MHLIHGKSISDDELTRDVFDRIDDFLLEALNEPLSQKAVINACDALSQSIHESEQLPLLLALGESEIRARFMLKECKRILSADFLTERVRREIDIPIKNEDDSESGINSIRQSVCPLGVLLHITSANVDALPAYSAVEGLLTGNVNLVKLPRGEKGLTNFLLLELMRLEPAIRKKVFVFDISSEDPRLKKLMDVSNGIVVWGGEGTVTAVRRAAKPSARIIEWGNRISFAYVSGKIENTNRLADIADNICQTEQLFCSSCQGIYLDTDSYEETVLFAHKFSEILECQSKRYSANEDLFTAAKRTISLYTGELEAICAEKHIFRGETSAVIACNDKLLEPCALSRCPWVKPLPRREIIKNLRRNGASLQTCALICDKEDRKSLENALILAGVTRVTDGNTMSNVYSGQPHDGEFSLRRYQKIVSFENSRK